MSMLFGCNKASRLISGSAICACMMIGFLEPGFANAGELPSPSQAAIDRSEIIELFSWSLIAFDNKDYSRFLSAFAPQSTFTVVDADPQKSLSFPRADMVKNWSLRAGSPGGDHHSASNLSVTFSDKTHAKLHGYYVWLKPSPSGPVIAAGIGSYDVKLIKLGERWQFADYRLLHSGAGSGEAPLD